MIPKPPPGVDPNRSIWLPGQVPSSKNNKEIGFIFCSEEQVKAEASNWFFLKKTEKNPKGELKMIRPSLRNSERSEKYIHDIVVHIIENKRKFQQLIKGLPKPYFIQLHFVRKTKARHDFNNASQILTDCMSGHYWENHKTIPHIATKWIDDDDTSNIYCVPPPHEPFFSVNSKCPGVWITVLKREAKMMDNAAAPELFEHKSIVEQMMPEVERYTDAWRRLNSAIENKKIEGAKVVTDEYLANPDKFNVELPDKKNKLFDSYSDKYTISPRIIKKEGDRFTLYFVEPVSAIHVVNDKITDGLHDFIIEAIDNLFAPPKMVIRAFDKDVMEIREYLRNTGFNYLPEE